MPFMSSCARAGTAETIQAARAAAPQNSLVIHPPRTFAFQCAASHSLRGAPRGIARKKNGLSALEKGLSEGDVIDPEGDRRGAPIRRLEGLLGEWSSRQGHRLDGEHRHHVARVLAGDVA